MPKSPAPQPHQKITPEGSIKLDRKHRHSLQPQSLTEVPPSALRHTQSHRYDSQGKKKKKSFASQIPSIIESENSEDELEKEVVLRVDKVKPSVVYESEKKTSKVGAKVKGKEGVTKVKEGVAKVKEGTLKGREGSVRSAQYVFENPAFDGPMNSKRNSAATSSRAPSIQSLEIVREQYCCCAKRTKCERTLLIIVIVFGIIIIVLIIVIVFVAKHDDISDIKNKLSF